MFKPMKLKPLSLAIMEITEPRVCCGCEQANAEQSRLNKQIMTDFKRRVEGEQ